MQNPKRLDKTKLEDTHSYTHFISFLAEVINILHRI